MSTVTGSYSQYFLQTEEQRSAARAALERHRAENGISGPPKTANNDAVSFSEQGKMLAASSSMSREEMEALSYAHLLQFEAEDGSTVSVDLALDPDSEERYLAARITITKPDGTEESLYISFDVIRGEKAGENEAGAAAAEDAAEEEETDATAEALAAATEAAEPSLMELIEQYGLNKIADASEGLFAAIRARIEAMIQAAEETAEETEELEQIKEDREARADTAAGSGQEASAGNTAVGQELNPVSGKTARGLAGYARSASTFTAGMGSFSRHY